METKNLVSMVLAITVGIICIGSVMVPVISDATKTVETLDNTADALGYLISIDSETDDYTLTWDVDDPDVVLVNGEEVSLYAGTILCGSPDFLIRYYSGSTDYLQGRTSDSADNFTASSSLSMTVSSGTITIVSDESTTKTYSITSGFAISSDGDYVMKAPTQEAYMKLDSELYAFGVSGTDTSTIWLKLTGTPESVVATSFSGPSGTFSNYVIHSTVLEDYVDTVALEKITFDWTNASTEVVTGLTYSYFIVPASVTAELSEHLTSAEIGLLAIIPIMAIIAVLMIAVRAVNRD